MDHEGMARVEPTPTPVVVLDGGLSTALEQQGADIRGDLWTARLLVDAPERIAAHRASFAAGAQVATTASYQASVEGFVAAGCTEAEARRLITRSVTLAQEVRDEFANTGSRPRVAASVGPYGAFLADGSEYRGNYGVPRTRLRDFHRRRLDLLASAQPTVERGRFAFAVRDLPEARELVRLGHQVDQDLRVVGPVADQPSGVDRGV